MQSPIPDSGTPAPTERQCPACAATVPVHYGYVSWCDACGWNLRPPEEQQPANVYEKMYKSLGERFSRQLHESVVGARLTRSGMTVSRFSAMAVAGVVHATTLIFLALGVLLVVLYWPNVFAIAGGLLCLGIAIVLRPRFGRPPKIYARREDFPALYGIVDSVAGALGAPKVDMIMVDDSFNASFMVVGMRRRRVVTVGLPFFLVLDPQERVAIIGHELGHSINGDSSRGFYVGSAIQSLSQWHLLLRPESLLSSESGMPGFIMLPFNAILYCMAGVAWSGAYMLSHLLYRDGQRAEYLADHFGAQAAGTSAMCGALDKCHLDDMFEFAVQKGANNPQGPGVFAELLHQHATLPERERERYRRIARMSDARLDLYHPPTHYRIAYLQSLDPAEPKVVLSAEESERLDREFEQAAPAIQKAIVDNYIAAISY